MDVADVADVQVRQAIWSVIICSCNNLIYAANCHLPSSGGHPQLTDENCYSFHMNIIDNFTHFQRFSRILCISRLFLQDSFDLWQYGNVAMWQCGKWIFIDRMEDVCREKRHTYSGTWHDTYLTLAFIKLYIIGTYRVMAATWQRPISFTAGTIQPPPPTTTLQPRPPTPVAEQQSRCDWCISKWCFCQFASFFQRCQTLSGNSLSNISSCRYDTIMTPLRHVYDISNHIFKMFDTIMTRLRHVNSFFG